MAPLTDEDADARVRAGTEGSHRPDAVRRVLPVLVYGGLLILLVGVLAQLWSALLPGSLATRIGHNSEGYLFTLVLAAWIQYVRPRLAGAPREVIATAAAAVLALATGLGLLASGWDSRFVTLNETCIALSVLIPWTQVRGPWSCRLALAISGVALVLMVVGGERVPLVTDQAEALGFLLLVPLALGVVDTGVLDPTTTTSTARRWLWYVAMLAVPVVLSTLEYRIEVDGLLGTGTRFGVRITESFIGTLLLSAYLAIGLGRTGRRPRV